MPRPEINEVLVPEVLMQPFTEWLRSRDAELVRARWLDDPDEADPLPVWLITPAGDPSTWTRGAGR